MQMILYSEPSTLTTPEEHNSERKSIIESRVRIWQKQMGSMDVDASSLTPVCYSFSFRVCSMDSDSD
ncbi:uncharacterized protein PG986_002606 [Apiospora aurea]|uniref:Uncharacterized protein n=1 Tax=Apiospora aurea TaxID=335848 RepID=A0ABR1QQZ7_9PEZI